jgi:predicted AlkP superfamily pyrophosphatase or phosphodiesterase
MGMAHGSLPGFARLMRRGASGPLATLRPTEGPPLWTTIVTGLLPRDHGVKSFATYRLKGSAGPFELLPKEPAWDGSRRPAWRRRRRSRRQPGGGARCGKS